MIPEVGDVWRDCVRRLRVVVVWTAFSKLRVQKGRDQGTPRMLRYDRRKEDKKRSDCGVLGEETIFEEYYARAMIRAATRYTLFGDL